MSFKHCMTPGWRLWGIVLLLSAAVATAPVFAGGQVEEEDIAEIDREGLEAPALAALVEQGELPPLEDRLPVNPKVLEPVEEPGRYGGMIRSVLIGSGDGGWFGRTVNYEGMTTMPADWSGTIPNIAEEIEVSDDATEFTFRLREGMRWSDGEPYTVDDIMFWYEDVLLNDELTEAYPGWMTADGELATIEKIDDYTFRKTFAGPNSLYLSICWRDRIRASAICRNTT